MPAKTPEQLKEKAAALRKKLEQGSAKLDEAGVRALKKRIRRAQRRRRTLAALATKRSGAGKDKKEA
jgi:hypothetical protein